MLLLETRDRTLEEIDLHFEKGRTEKTEIRMPHVEPSWAFAIGTCSDRPALWGSETHNKIYKLRCTAQVEAVKEGCA